LRPSEPTKWNGPSHFLYSLVDKAGCTLQVVLYYIEEFSLLFHKNGDVKEHVVQFPDVGLQLHDLLVTSLDLVESLPLLSRVNEVLWKQFYSMPLQSSPSPLYSPLCDSL
jgi:hypothetical protein